MIAEPNIAYNLWVFTMFGEKYKEESIMKCPKCGEEIKGMTRKGRRVCFNCNTIFAGIGDEKEPPNVPPAKPAGAAYSRCCAKEPHDDLIGNFIDEKCPRCGATLLGNKVGDKWCSYIRCSYGLRSAAD